MFLCVCSRINVEKKKKKKASDKRSPGICACGSDGLLMDFRVCVFGVLTIKLVLRYPRRFQAHYLQ